MATRLPADWCWVFDLISPTPGRRKAAMTRHSNLLRKASAAMERMNVIWAQARASTLRVPHYNTAGWDQAAAAYHAARSGTIFGPLDLFLSGTYLTNRHQHDRFASFAVLFLQWERRYPHEWAEAGTWTWSHWGMKELLLRRFAEAGVPIGVQRDVVELVGAAVAGPYRCKDWRYALLARLVDGTSFRETFTAPLGSVDPLPHLRSRFLLHLLDHPGIAIRRHTWHRWHSEQRERAEGSY